MTWQWKDKTWVPYDDQTNIAIETAYTTYTQNGGPSSFSFTAPFSPDLYVIDFTENKQVNQRTQFYRFIRRIDTAIKRSFEKNLRNGAVPLGIKGVTSLLLPKEVWHINDIANLRIVGTDGLPPKCVAPHITLLDSFSSTDRFEKVSQMFIEAASNFEPFEVTLRQLKYFTHGTKRGFTLYLEPEITPTPGTSTNHLSDLQRALYHQVNNSGCLWLESNTSPEKFIPHVSLGKVSTIEKLQKIISDYSSRWQPISFYVTEIYILSKLVHDTVIRCVVPLGKIPQIRKFDIIPFPSDSFYSVNINWVPPESSEEDLRAVFVGYNVVKAEVIVKTIELKGYKKGWGNVIFSSKEERDGALRKRFFMNGRELEMFPCD